MRKKTFDVIVAGGGSAGLAAAVGAQRTGASTLLIERHGCLGGQAASANVFSYCGFFTHEKEPRQVVYGIGEEVLCRLHRLGSYDGFQRSAAGNAIIVLNIEDVKLTFDELIRESGAAMLLHCSIVSLKMDASGRKICSVIGMDDEGEIEFSAKEFVDATGDANLGYMAGAEYWFGDGRGNAQMASRVMLISGVEPGADLTPKSLEGALRQAKRDGLHLTRESGIVFHINENTVAAILPSAELPALSAEALTRAEVDTRRQCRDYITAFQKYVRGMENCHLVSSGGFLGVRDTRHLVTEHVLTDEEILNCRKQERPVARGAWPSEVHRELNKMADYIFLKDNGYYEIPLEALKVRGISNLWCAGRTLGAEPLAYASIRTMGTGFATGHAAGVAAGLSAAGYQADYEKIRRELNRQNAQI